MRYIRDMCLFMKRLGKMSGFQEKRALPEINERFPGETSGSGNKRADFQEKRALADNQ
ncbi:hypothetical protein QNH10_04125 [Sporosarcina thermotolerans]|uniref:hypothetical protein n=1 Tax=Sporosarcina thermotolerans TaxID=633404 RepID=UPI0024BC35AB|nr:hypothetical protein [Sporosarcina thermotolerans]WHT48906.1 hypothetical protein QNH10_04125 [Sporosarcina thermotolerans]